jgi:hypothetical protein
MVLLQFPELHLLAVLSCLIIQVPAASCSLSRTPTTTHPPASNARTVHEPHSAVQPMDPASVIQTATFMMSPSISTVTFTNRTQHFLKCIAICLVVAPPHSLLSRGHVRCPHLLHVLRWQITKCGLQASDGRGSKAPTPQCHFSPNRCHPCWTRSAPPLTMMFALSGAASQKKMRGGQKSLQ